MVVTRLRPLSFGRSVAVVTMIVTMVVTLCFMLLFGVLTLTGMVRGWLGWAPPVPDPFGPVGLPEALILPVAVIFSGVRAFVVAVLFAVIYNLFARRFRILEIEAD